VTAAKKKPKVWKFNPERLLILITSLGLAVYLVVKGIQEGKIDYIYALGLTFVVIGYFARDLTGQEDDEEPKL
jgi:hypothetical protein